MGAINPFDNILNFRKQVDSLGPKYRCNTPILIPYAICSMGLKKLNYTGQEFMVNAGRYSMHGASGNGRWCQDKSSKGQCFSFCGSCCCPHPAQLQPHWLQMWWVRDFHPESHLSRVPCQIWPKFYVFFFYVSVSSTWSQVELLQIHPRVASWNFGH